MRLKFPNFLRNLLKATKFWQSHYLILREFKYFRKSTVLALIFTLLAASFEGVSIGFLLSFLQSLITPDQPAKIGVPFLDNWIQSNAAFINPIYIVSLLILVSTWIRSAFGYFAGIYNEKVQLTLADRLRKQIFEQLQSLPLGYFTDTRSGELVNTMTTEIERLKQVFSALAFTLTRTTTVIVYFICMFAISWQLSLITAIVFSLIAAGITTLNRRVREASFGISNANAVFNANAFEFINGIRTVQAFATQDYERQRFYRNSLKLYNASNKVVYAWILVKPVADAIATTAMISLIIVSFTKFTIPAASLLTFFFVLARVVPSLQDINGTLAFLGTLTGSLEAVKELLRTDNKSYFENGHVKFTGLKRSIDLISVDFAYDNRNLVLHNVTLSIERGKMTALVGSSGAGKTTLADLIPRFYDVTQGQIFIEGVDLRMLDINTLRQRMAVVSQDTFIFNASVRDNIAYGSPNATEAQIREVAKLANALDFIEDMPQGFDSKLGDRGVRLSGGQRQRIAIARALLRDPEILILDEATSALDSVSERLIQESIEQLSVGRTVIAIAHRLSTIAKADKVVVLEGGYIVEQGGYQDLLQQRGKFWRYHQMQHNESGYAT